ncbi:23S rRNA (pseudouridine(1915)-N(3))-methyltransferase RlmH [Candidatus Izimaplasma bacterium ZiA1]|uniref:23S rRNA (pseudouridine(1915)-N(3))-methyltransferase RlmH n=1 Tax=Candidatus Izimoplasma sp. ZiA1 TaxID=2024899 RepID=UPI000BAA6761|nr:23S rRNA (pseudouridine(1915)-N(3))-methyltransferase RlmH [Candidatus Izimaplasma bacterium ZiA1]
MKITVISVGKLKEKYLVDGIKEYSKRLSKYTKLELIEVKDEHAPENLSLKDIEIIKDTEGKRIDSKIKDSFIISLAIEGKQLTSEDLSKKIEEIKTYNNSHITFIIGGSLGLSKDIINKSNYLLSFSKMTFPHQLMKLILLEQIYRSFRITNNEPYHK